MRISDWSSDVCSSDLEGDRGVGGDRIGLLVDVLVLGFDSVEFQVLAAERDRGFILITVGVDIEPGNAEVAAIAAAGIEFDIAGHVAAVARVVLSLEIVEFRIANVIGPRGDARENVLDGDRLATEAV